MRTGRLQIVSDAARIASELMFNKHLQPPAREQRSGGIISEGARILFQAIQHQQHDIPHSQSAPFVRAEQVSPPVEFSRSGACFAANPLVSPQC
jgi:hypothetical protein